MSLKSPIYHEFDLAALKGDSKPIRITHIDDTNVDVVELCVRQGGSKIDLTGATVTARIVLHAKRDYLINDNVQCTVNDSGNVLIPFDNAVIESHKGVLKIEVNIKRAEDVLTLQFPLWVMVNDTILATAEVLPESEGTIPELLKEAAEELERVKDFVTRENVFEILDGTLQGNPNTAPTLLIDNTIDQQFNPDGHWIMFYIDSEDVRHNLFDFANLSSGTSDYQELENKPQINSHTLSGNKSSDDLGLQKKLKAGTNITISNDGTISAEGGGSQIVSGVVNQNGTITFTNSDGTTFTTTGASVIGDDGFSPVATVTQTQSGATVTITDKNGTTTANISNGADGQDYVLTAQDKSDIADIVLSELPTTEGVLYGN